MWRQQTINGIIECTGIGVHSGARVTLTLRPAPAGKGVVFRRTDLKGQPEIPARLDNLADSRQATKLAVNGASVMTVEHLLAAAAGAGVDNLIVDLDGPELPIMDGSAAPFLMLIKAAGLKELKAPRQAIKIKKTVQVNLDDRRVEVSPAETVSLTCAIEFNHPAVGCQKLSVDLDPELFDQEISRARTFGFLEDIERLRKIGLAQGGSLDNAIVVDQFKVLNPGGLRFEDEFVRHKILDMIGDLALLGKPVIGHICAHKTGHALNHELLKKIEASPDNWELIDLSPPVHDAPIPWHHLASDHLAEPSPA